MNKVTKEMNQVGQDFIGPILFHQIMLANNDDILNSDWNMNDPRLNLEKDHLSEFWCPYTSTVHQMSNMFNIALDCSVAPIRDEIFENFETHVFVARKVAKNYNIKEPGKCFT